MSTDNHISNAAMVTLGQIAMARSGDKGNHANLGVVAFNDAGYQFLRDHLSADRVRQFFASLGSEKVVRYELPRVNALNFFLYDVLAGGASRSLRIDTQGKLLGTAALEITFPAPDNLDELVQRE